MNAMITCEECRERLSLEPDTSGQPEVAAHLASCASCAREAELFTAMHRELMALPPPQPSAALRSRTHAAIQAEPPMAIQAEAPVTSKQPATPRRTLAETLASWLPAPRLAWPLGIAATACLLFIAIGTHRSAPVVTTHDDKQADIDKTDNTEASKSGAPPQTKPSTPIATPYTSTSPLPAISPGMSSSPLTAPPLNGLSPTPLRSNGSTNTQYRSAPNPAPIRNRNTGPIAESFITTPGPSVSGGIHEGQDGLGGSTLATAPLASSDEANRIHNEQANNPSLDNMLVAGMHAPGRSAHAVKGNKGDQGLTETNGPIVAVPKPGKIKNGPPAPDLLARLTLLPSLADGRAVPNAQAQVTGQSPDQSGAKDNGNQSADGAFTLSQHAPAAAPPTTGNTRLPHFMTKSRDQEDTNASVSHKATKPPSGAAGAQGPQGPQGMPDLMAGNGMASVPAPQHELSTLRVGKASRALLTLWPKDDAPGALVQVTVPKGLEMNGHAGPAHFALWRGAAKNGTPLGIVVTLKTDAPGDHSFTIELTSVLWRHGEHNNSMARFNLHAAP